MKKIGVVGHGYVGEAIEKFFADHYSISIYDPAKGKKNKGAINKCDLAVICVPTPMAEDGSVDLSIIEEIFSWLKAPLILIKSTVPPGTTAKYIENKDLAGKVAFSPEYIGEGKYHVPYWRGYPHATDMKKHDFFIFGGDRETTAKVIEFFKPVTGPDAKYIQTDATTAELTKYMENCWGATKVTFCNEFYEIAKSMGVCYNELRELLLLDGRLERMHTVVFEDKRGFGGKCYPKDVNGIVKASRDAGYNAKLLKEVLRSNKKFTNKNKS